MIKLAIFASGSGSNAEKIMEYFSEDAEIKVSVVCSNKSSAYVLTRAEKYKVPTIVFDRSDFDRDSFLQKLSSMDIDAVILAGFLWKIPAYMIEAYPDKIINIHPALLPNYGGKGMYGDRVHQAVLDAHEKKSGITIHLVNENYDEGQILFQAECEVTEGDTVDSLAAKIHNLEHTHYPKVIQEYLLSGM